MATGELVYGESSHRLALYSFRIALRGHMEPDELGRDRSEARSCVSTASSERVRWGRSSAQTRSVAK